MGSPDFASGILEAILDEGSHQVIGVVTVADKSAGRGMKIQQSSVKICAEKYNLPILQPEKLRDEQFITELKASNADVFVVVAFRMLPEVVWKIPPKGTINLHASLLPQYRGAAPINWAIINGETQTGVTTFFINDKIDEGNILLSQKIDISSQDNAGTLHDKLMNIGKQVVLETLKQIDEGTYQEQKQPQTSNLKTAPKISKEDCLINWNLPVEQIYNFIRGMSPYPCAFSRYKNDKGENLPIKIFSCRAEKTSHNFSHGIIETDNKNFMRVTCNDGYIYIEELQLLGKKRLFIHEFLLGNKGFDGVILH
jgi:methionyl-tRNA formyltransferase